jgi:hypothetical protein
MGPPPTHHHPHNLLKYDFAGAVGMCPSKQRVPHRLPHCPNRRTRATGERTRALHGQRTQDVYPRYRAGQGHYPMGLLG